ncbi:MAG: preprotein translocase subunit SecA [Chloroflexi bacterium]|nr:preprotein translocase subunit SecA [Chloroflexota bacterium]MDL1885516.1 preprotein translocase subunit SecA [Anaerolineae bacterium CFX8]
MFKSIVKKVVGDPIERAMSRYREVIDRINALEPDMKKLSDADLRAKTAAFKRRLAEGAALDELLVEAYAVVREASVRTIGLRHYDVQLIGGIVLHQGRIAEMKTGEGKTLVATLPLYLNALSGQGAHLVTPNDYLSKVGAQTMGPIYHFLGLSVAVIQSKGDSPDPDAGSFLFDPNYPSDDARYQNLRPCKRRECYEADITYGTNNEFGFDYLRDNMVYEPSQLAQRDLNYAIVDEVDNILIDEARTPLIISGPSDEPSDYYKKFAEVVRRLKPSTNGDVKDEEPDGDYIVDIKDRVVYLTERGVERVENILGIDQLYHPSNSEMIPYLDNSLRALALYHRDKEYVVQNGREGPEVIIVDEFTGRLMYGRRFSEGLHQAIEAKEGVKIRRENMTLATITFQNFFRMYRKLAGMTGTALTEQEEFEKIYNLEVVAIPTNLPIIRQDHDDLVFMTEKAKFNAVVQEIKQRQERGQPVLVGTVAIETSERLSKALDRAGIKHEVLNAKQHEREAGIIAQAGRPGAVTIATNMAGRGVDILLGGNPEGLAREKLRRQGIEITQATPEQWQQAFAEARAQCAEDRQKVLAAGGLFVLGTERHEARRIDNQLRGRSGRQGDPGETRFYLSLEDDLMKRFGGDRVKGFMSWANIPEDEPIQHGMITRSIAQAQVRVEGYNFDIRKRVLEYDDVVNKQREVLYARRRDIVFKENLRDDYLKILEEAVLGVLDEYAPENTSPDEWDLEAMYRQLLTIFPVPEPITPETMAGRTLEELETLLIEAVHKAYHQKEQELGMEMMPRLEKWVMLRTIDQHWQRHLTDLDVLREGIGLMSVAQRDPLVEYKRQAFGMWQGMMDQIRVQAATQLLMTQVAQRQPQPAMRRQMQLHAARAGGAAESKPEPVRAQHKLGRNDPCWCGSGKKYKHCHYKQDRGGQAS